MPGGQITGIAASWVYNKRLCPTAIIISPFPCAAFRKNSHSPPALDIPGLPPPHLRFRPYSPSAPPPHIHHIYHSHTPYYQSTGPLLLSILTATLPPSYTIPLQGVLVLPLGRSALQSQGCAAISPYVTGSVTTSGFQALGPV